MNTLTETQIFKEKFNNSTDITIDDLWAFTEKMEAEKTRWKEDAKKWENLYDEVADIIMDEQDHDSFGPTETLAECAKRLIEERFQAQKENEEQARLLGKSGSREAYLLSKLEDIERKLMKAQKLIDSIDEIAEKLSLTPVNGQN